MTTLTLAVFLFSRARGWSCTSMEVCSFAAHS